MAELPPASSLSGFQLKPVEFEKDVDTNFHMDFIASTANLRATNYSIPNVDKHTCKGIAGKIIPAMVTTTAVVCGFAVIELLKIVSKSTRLLRTANNFPRKSLMDHNNYCGRRNSSVAHCVIYKENPSRR